MTPYHGKSGKFRNQVNLKTIESQANYLTDSPSSRNIAQAFVFLGGINGATDRPTDRPAEAEAEAEAQVAERTLEVENIESIE